MKKMLTAALTALFAAVLCMSAAAETELVVFAAASLTETLTKIGERYEEENPDITLAFNFDSSGTLKTQIEEGADCDVFLSAGQKQMNELDLSAGEEKNPDQLDFVKEDSRIDLLENKVALVVPGDNPKKIGSFSQLAELLKDGEILRIASRSFPTVRPPPARCSTGWSSLWPMTNRPSGSCSLPVR